MVPLLLERKGCALRDPATFSEVEAEAISIGRLTRRADFLRAAKGRRWHGKGFSLQGAPAKPSVSQDDASLAHATRDDSRMARVGFTVTKKVGCSVVRNRARRRLREALRLAEGLPVMPAHDYVVIARVEALRLPFSTLKTDLRRAIRGLHAEIGPRDKKKRPSGAPASTDDPRISSTTVLI